MPRLASANQKTVRHRSLDKLSAWELGRPKARLGNPNTGIPEVIVQPIYDIYAVAAAATFIKLYLFTIVLGQSYAFGGVTSFQKGNNHTNLVQAGMLESSYSYIVRALSVICFGLQGASGGMFLSYIDYANFISSFFQFQINKKSYFDGIGAWLPGGGGAFSSGIGSLTAPAATVTTQNGWPESRNVYPLPGGQFINPQETFTFLIDPTQNAGGTPTAAAAVASTAGVPAQGIMAWIRLDGTLNRVAQ
jgi:hypothetical protein